jgi:hypothetical protein
VEPTDEEIRDWKEQVRLNTLVHEYAREKLKGQVFVNGREDGDEFNATVKCHYTRLAEESKELSEIFQKMLSEIEDSIDVARLAGGP